MMGRSEYVRGCRGIQDEGFLMVEAPMPEACIQKQTDKARASQLRMMSPKNRCLFRVYGAEGVLGTTD